jgi:ornithine carbamoyltransferase|tara:strand:- start:484 stop:696 length:213 start_codon:yes stop_codon:yes gene_type:complete
MVYGMDLIHRPQTTSSAGANQKGSAVVFETSSTRKRVKFETPMIHSLARRVGIAAPFRGLPHTTGSAGGN